MNTSSRWRWSALAVTLGIAVPAARAEMITPDSISNPPSAVSATDGTPVYASNYVTTQYAGMGLNFSNGVAITNLNGVSAWVPMGIGAGNAVGPIDYAWGLPGNFVSPGTSNPMTVSSLSVDVIGLSGSQTVSVNGNGQFTSIVPAAGGSGQVWTFTGTNITAFSVSPSIGGPWGVASISFSPTTATAPEPSSLVLAGLGALGLAVRQRWRRIRAIA